MAKKETLSKTILVIILLSLICSVLVSGAAVLLKPLQDKNKALDKQINILKVAGLPTDNVAESYTKYIEAKLVKLDTGEFVDGDANKYDFQKAAKDPKQSLLLPAAEDLAGIRSRPNVMPVYLSYDEQRQLKNIIVPVYGMGLWSTMYAYVAIAPDVSQYNGITYYEQGETAGLGAEIENPNWAQQFIGKRVYNEQGKSVLKVVKGGAPKGSDWGVDGLSGATLTSAGVQNTFDFWMGAMGYQPFLKRISEQQAAGDL